MNGSYPWSDLQMWIKSEPLRMWEHSVERFWWSSNLDDGKRYFAKKRNRFIHVATSFPLLPSSSPVLCSLFLFHLLFITFRYVPCWRLCLHSNVHFVIYCDPRPSKSQSMLMYIHYSWIFLKPHLVQLSIRVYTYSFIDWIFNIGSF